MAVANHVLWPLAKFVNAKLVPKQHQPVANKVVQVLYPLLPPFIHNDWLLVKIQLLARHAFLEGAVEAFCCRCSIDQQCHYRSKLSVWLPHIIHLLTHPPPPPQWLTPSRRRKHFNANISPLS